MAQRKQLSWTELRVGVFVLAGIVLVVLGIFYVTGTGAWGPKYRLVTYLPEVAGLTLGAPVTLDGVEVGNVDTIRMAPVSRPAAQSRSHRRGRHEAQPRFPERHPQRFNGQLSSPKASWAIASSTFSAATPVRCFSDGQEVPGLEKRPSPRSSLKAPT